MKLSSPATRAALAGLPAWVADALESGKFFPMDTGGEHDMYAPDDVVSEPPPADGRIASAGKAEATALDAAGTAWSKVAVTARTDLEITWRRGPQARKTRRIKYFLTTTSWNPDKPLTRDQFDLAPFDLVESTAQPYWGTYAANPFPNGLTPSDPLRHTVFLPERSGYHVLLAVAEIADTGNAFYQVVDLDFG